MKRVAIIGAGLGGLSAGALLAKKGYKVSLLEQHSVVGGCATTFNRKGITCEVGLHEMDGVYSDPEMKKIFTMLKVYENVEFVKAPEFFTVTTKNGDFTMPDGVDSVIEALCDRFPDENESIHTYFKVIEKISGCFETMVSMNMWHIVTFPFWAYAVLRYKNRTVTQVFDTLFKDDELKLILNANVQYYDDSPDTLSFLLHAVAQYSYYNGGGYFIKGGSGRLSDYLASIITDNGGDVITRANVTHCNGNHVYYKVKNEEKTLVADTIISNLSPETTYALFNEPYKESKTLSTSLLTIYMGFDCNLKKEYGKHAYSHIIAEDIDSLETFNHVMQQEITKRPFVFVDYSQIDARLCDEEKSHAVVCCTNTLDEWETLSPESYKDKKHVLEEAVLQKLEHYYPDIKSHLLFMETGTAKTMQRYVKTPNATAYGYKPTPKQFFRIPQPKSKKINNLYFVGQWMIAGGFRPAILSGYLCYKKLVAAS